MYEYICAASNIYILQNALYKCQWRLMVIGETFRNLQSLHKTHNNIPEYRNINIFLYRIINWKRKWKESFECQSIFRKHILPFQGVNMNVWISSFIIYY